MHMGNSIICPVTGGVMLLAMAGSIFYSAKKADFSKKKLFQIISLTVFVFALQMINFAIPYTGSSGHIIGGLLLAVLLGAHAGFIAMTSILLVQALFFADGGLLALGCNIFNMGFLACFVIYPFIYKPFENKNMPLIGAFLSSILALQLGSIAVVVEAYLSGTIAAGAVISFLALMQAIHLPIGLAEGLFSVIVIKLFKTFEVKKMCYSFFAFSVILAGGIFHYASNKPDGLEWSLLNIGNSIVPQTQNIYQIIQAKIMLLSHTPSLAANFIGIMALICLMGLFYLISNRRLTH